MYKLITLLYESVSTLSQIIRTHTHTHTHTDTHTHIYIYIYIYIIMSCR